MRIVPLSGTGARARRRTVGLATVAAALLAAAASLATTPAEALAPIACRYAYTVIARWPGGFQAEMAVTTPGRLTGWTVTWDFAGTERVTSGWNGIFSQSGQHVTVTNPPWHPTIGADATVRPGFVAAS